MKGKIIFWHPTKYFGIIEIRNKQNIGWTIDKYFLHASRITFQAVEEVHQGCWVRFAVAHPFDPAKPALLPDVVQAEIFETQEQLEAAEKSGEAVQS